MTISITIIFYAWLLLGCLFTAYFIKDLFQLAIEILTQKNHVSRYKNRPAQPQIRRLFNNTPFQEKLRRLGYFFLIFITGLITIHLIVALTPATSLDAYVTDKQPRFATLFDDTLEPEIRNRNNILAILAGVCSLPLIYMIFRLTFTQEKPSAFDFICTIITTVIAVFTYFGITPASASGAIAQSSPLIIINNSFASSHSTPQATPSDGPEAQDPQPDTQKDTANFIFAAYFEHESFTLSAAQLSVLKPLGQSLRGCIDTASSTRNVTPLTLEFRGHTSSSPFDKNSDMSNVSLSDLRAQAIYQALGLTHSPPRLNILVHKWDDENNGSVKRPINDLYKPGQEPTPMERLNRVATIDLTKAGRCEISSD